MSKDNKVAIGIDLGTTYSCISCYKNGRVEIIANDQGNRTTPSYVAFTDNQRLYGDAAKNQAAMNPRNTIYDAKRLIGRGFDDPIVKRDMELWPFEVVGRNNKPYIVANDRGEKREFSPEEISSMVLSEMKRTAESYLGHEIDEAVITVPAYFNDSQRQATKDAATIAGLKVLRIINEPTAAAIAYGLSDSGNDNDEEKHVLIFDCGGGTFDVSLLAIEDGMFEVKATGGDTHLGGEDFDQRLVEHFVNEFKRKYKKDLTTNPRSIRRLKTACERAKRTLSSSSQAPVEIDSLYDGIDFYTNITRARFEELCSDLFLSCLKPVEKVLRDAKIGKSDVDEIVLVGGSTRIPKLQRLLSNFFNGKKLCQSISPDESVSYGACIQAAILNRTISEKDDNIVLVDVIPLTLGIETRGQLMTKIIEANTKIPTEKSDTFTTAVDNQPAVTIKIFQGERALTKDNHLLGEFSLEGIPPAPRGTPKIKVSFNVDENGILKVQAKDEATGKEKNITISNNSSRLSPDEIKRLKDEAKQFESQDKKIKENLMKRGQLETSLYTVKAKLNEKSDALSNDDKTTLEKACNETQAWLNNNKTATTEELQKITEEFEKKIQPIIAKIYSNPTNSNANPTYENNSNQAPGPKIEEVD